MPKQPTHIPSQDAAEQAAALAQWFISQEITTGQAIVCMSYLIGTMAAAFCEGPADMFAKLNTVDDVMNGVAQVKYRQRFSKKD